ncbi:AAA domain-containing protein [Pseudomonas flavescens]|uniref:AAA domain-containing protein n=1 Tax=Phytopseudomonas flavescens TaxID=29435 RepID=A0A1G7YZU6_9GAMM|nr:AAA family ATPase [Pseudomonas flavescens]SDH02062.1 AAA domain-containing protein [Pseudomonas flavescens]
MNKPLLAARIVNPDDYLETPAGRVFSAERSQQAWEHAYRAVEALLAQASRLYLVMGVQGAGKSSWISRHAAGLDEHAVIFDAALPARRHRERLLALARAYEVPVVAVFVQASLEQALSRNAARAADKVVPEHALRSVFAMLEVPSLEEGIDTVILHGSASNSATE